MATGQKENDGEGRRRRRRGELGDATVSSPARWGRWILSLENPSVPQWDITKWKLKVISGSWRWGVGQLLIRE
jgi:hypothetical protein